MDRRLQQAYETGASAALEKFALEKTAWLRELLGLKPKQELKPHFGEGAPPAGAAPGQPPVQHVVMHRAEPTMNEFRAGLLQNLRQNQMHRELMGAISASRAPNPYIGR